MIMSDRVLDIAASGDQQPTNSGDIDTEDASLFESDEFRIYCYKVLPCAKRQAHEWTTCPWAHPGEKARRRDPRVYNYLAIPCPETKDGKECPRGDDCPNCHSLFEYWLHPSRYRTQLCRNNDGSHCKRQICFFAHSIEELRVPDHSHLYIPDKDKQQDDAPTAAAAAAATAGSPKQSSGKPAGSSPRAAVAHGANTSSNKRDRRGSKGSSRLLPIRDAGTEIAAAGSPTPTTSGVLPAPLDLPFSPCTPNPAAAAALQATALPGSTSTAANGAAAAAASAPVVTVGMQQHVERSLSCALSAPSTPAAALRRATSLEVAQRKAVSLDMVGPGSSYSNRMPATPTPSGPALAATSSLFSSSMMADPEVPDPMHSPTAGQQLLQQQQQQQLLQLQKEQLEAYDQQVQVQQLLLAQHQQQQQQLKQQASWGSGKLCGSWAEYSSGGSPPLSPTPSAVTSCCSSIAPERISEDFSSMGSCSSYAASTYGGYGPPAGAGVGAGWRPPLLPRTVSGPPAYGLAFQSPAQYSAGAFRYHSLDSGSAAAAQAAAAASQLPGSTAEVAAAARAQLEMMQCNSRAAMAAAAASAGMPSCYSSLSFPANSAPAVPAAAVPPASPGLGEQLNLADVADLVDSVNRGDLGECGNQVLTGVIGLLMQQLQQQQLTA